MFSGPRIDRCFISDSVGILSQDWVFSGSVESCSAPPPVLAASMDAAALVGRTGKDEPVGMRYFGNMMGLPQSRRQRREDC